MELERLYVDVIVRRYKAATGEAAVLAETGERFLDLAARRSEHEGNKATGNRRSARFVREFNRRRPPMVIRLQLSREVA